MNNNQCIAKLNTKLPTEIGLAKCDYCGEVYYLKSACTNEYDECDHCDYGISLNFERECCRDPEHSFD
jgi:hypothetical protein